MIEDILNLSRNKVSCNKKEYTFVHFFQDLFHLKYSEKYNELLNAIVERSHRKRKWKSHFRKISLKSIKDIRNRMKT